MKKISFEKIISLTMFLVITAISFTTTINNAAALTMEDTFGGNNETTAFQNTTSLGDEDPRTIIANVIKILLGFLGIIAVVLILFGGFKWMTAAGNEDGVNEAKKLLAAGVIGLIIILMAYGLATFVINTLINATS